MARGAFTEYAMEQITAPVTRDLLMIHLGHVQSRCVQRPVLTEAVARYGNCAVVTMSFFLFLLLLLM
jgi:hypothetical protein